MKSRDYETLREVSRELRREAKEARELEKKRAHGGHYADAYRWQVIAKELTDWADWLDGEAAKTEAEEE